MKLSVNELLPSWVRDFYDFLMWLDADIGISTSGLRLAFSWIYWLRYVISYAMGQQSNWRGYFPVAFWWPITNAENSHNQRPWALWTEDNSFEV